MQQLNTILFWISLLLLFYSYIGYGVILELINSFKYGKITVSDREIKNFPSIAFLVAAYNEETCIEAKILNTLDLDYPSDSLHIYIITDGSTDETTRITRKYSQVILFHQAERIGKLGSLQRIIPELDEDLLLFTDANCLLNKEALKFLIPHFNNPAIGGVSGEKKIKSDDDPVAAEGIYWKYESWLKKQDATFYTLVGAAGELFCMRRALYQILPSKIILDDFVQSMKVCEQHYKVNYEQRAFATEAPSGSLSGEMERKIRICAGAFQSFRHIKFAFNPFNDFKIFFQFISHRFIRWTVAPVALVVLFISNFFLSSSNLFFLACFIIQCLFYTTALVGFYVSLRKLKVGAFYIPMYFVMMNLAVFFGFIRFISGSQSNLWKKVERKTAIR